MGIYKRKTDKKIDCPMEKTLHVITGKWKLAILCELNRGSCRLKDFEKHNPEASKRALTQQLKELVIDGIIEKEDFNVYPKKVIYSLTQKGQELIPIIEVLGKFGEKL